MRLDSRLKKLESRHALDEPHCSTCGYPQRGVIRIVYTEHDRPLPTCKACDRPLDEDGMPLVTPFHRVIVPSFIAEFD